MFDWVPTIQSTKTVPRPQRENPGPFSSQPKGALLPWHEVHNWIWKLKENRFVQYGRWKLLGVWFECWYSVLSSNLPIIINNKLLQHLVWLQALLLRLLRFLRSASTMMLRSWSFSNIRQMATFRVMGSRRPRSPTHSKNGWKIQCRVIQGFFSAFISHKKVHWLKKNSLIMFDWVPTIQSTKTVPRPQRENPGPFSSQPKGALLPWHEVHNWIWKLKENRFVQYGCWKLLGVWLECWYSVLSSNLPIIINNKFKLLQHLVWLQALLLRLLRFLRSASTMMLRSWNFSNIRQMATFRVMGSRRPRSPTHSKNGWKIQCRVIQGFFSGFISHKKVHWLKKNSLIMFDWVPTIQSTKTAPRPQRENPGPFSSQLSKGK